MKLASTLIPVFLLIFPPALDAATTRPFSSSTPVKSGSKKTAPARTHPQPKAKTVARIVPTATLTPIPSIDGSKPLYAFDTVWGSAGSNLNQLQFPEGIDVTDDEIFIADTGNNRVLVWDVDGKPLRTFGAFGPAAVWRNPPQFNRPTGIRVLPANKVYVVDTLNHRIVVVDGKGLVVTSWGSRGQGNGEFDRPRDIALDHYGNLWVLDSGNCRIQIFGGPGAYKNQWGSFGTEAGRMKYPLGFDLNIIDQACVADTENYRCQVFNDQGSSVTMFGWQGAGLGQFEEPGGVAVTPSGTIAVTDGANARVVFLNNRFEPIGDWRAPDPLPGAKQKPRFRGIASDRTGRLYITDMQNHRVVRLKPLSDKNVVIERGPTPTPADSGPYGGPGYPVR